MSEVAWRDWCEESFQEARQGDRPLLLFLKASWCRFCRSLEQEVFQDPEVAAEIASGYVPLRVDKDRRPDLDQRYNLGGWPTVAFLTPDGELITGGSALTRQEVRALVSRVAGYFREHREQIQVDLQRIIVEQEQAEAARVRRRAETRLSSDIVDRVAASTLEAFDRKYGGFGTGQKFPHPEALDFAILYFAKTRDPAFRELVVRTLSSMAEGRLFDPVSGGFFRFCGTRDWRRPHTEKLLETQTGLLRNYLEAWQLFDNSGFQKVALKILDYLESHLYDEQTGGWFGSQDADDEFYSLEAGDREDRKPPRVEPTLYTPSVAMCVSSLLKAGAVLEDEAVTRRALGGLHFLLERCYSRGKGMYHYFDGNRQILGLLSDQIYTARALIHAIQYTGDNDYLTVVEDLIGTIVAKQSATHGGFYDISEEDAKFGSLRRRKTSLLDNGVMAEVLVRAHYLSGDAGYLELAERTLQAFVADYPLYGYFTAGYARAVELFLHHPVRVVVVGGREDPERRRMLETAQSTYMPSRMIQAIDPQAEAELLAAHGFPARPETVTYVCVERACLAEITQGEQLGPALRKAEERRSARRA